MSEIVSIPNNQITNYAYDGLLTQISNMYNSYDWKFIPKSTLIDSTSSEEQIKEKLESLIKEFTELLDIIEEKQLNNEQWCLDGMDKMNEQSVRF